ncbi:hypothetical protein JAAARDRAFT_37068 [Jaapia argillacea MUCL 33604]|uniref:G-protein alpha subunit n=1 Tax=Jaapia argillacea MUCL 33604 TaxID=933084 RepID=A0A067PPD0_9AGAM|nr:hypothetical protein JAAARDRAFT_37068 [Jaapia argillacea MUCL 33604]
MARHPYSQSDPATSVRSVNTFRSAARPIDDAEALRISNRIDEELKREREAIRRRRAQKTEVKVILLGQAESGKSTLQKQFQLYYASKSLDGERPSWRPVVYFNVIKAVRMILDEIDWNESATSATSTTTSAATSDPSSSQSQPVASTSQTPPARPASPPSSPPATHSDLSAGISELRAKLLPLVALEDTLASELNGGVTVSGGRSGVFVRAGWQTLVSPNRNRSIANNAKVPAITSMAAKGLAETVDAIEELWKHPAVRQLLARRKLRLEESAAFFLDSIYRIAESEYLPSTEDILNVRLQTLGVIEHSFDISLAGLSFNWLMYDVGGARGQRHAWVPYFDDATAIIFLAPMSAYDQYLEEDPRTNRIDDSLQLFTAIVQNKLLQKAALVLMLNKADLLRQKLEAGIPVKKYITSYGDRPNTYEEVSEYFRAHFIQIHKKKDISQPRRSLYVHFTKLLDVKATQQIICHAGEAIIQSYMRQSGLA